MPTLSDITSAARKGDPLDPVDARKALAAYDVLLASLDVSRHPKQLEEYFRAAEAELADYLGWENDPDNPAAREWYAAMGVIYEPVTVVRRRVTPDNETSVCWCGAAAKVMDELSDGDVVRRCLDHAGG